MVEWWSADADAKAEAALQALPGRQKLRKRLADLMGGGSIEEVEVRGERLFVLKRSSSDLQPKLFVRDRDADSAPGPGPQRGQPGRTWALDGGRPH